MHWDPWDKENSNLNCVIQWLYCICWLLLLVCISDWSHQIGPVNGAMQTAFYSGRKLHFVAGHLHSLFPLCFADWHVGQWIGSSDQCCQPSCPCGRAGTAKIKKECQAIIWAVLTLQYYLLGRPVILCLNHAPLQLLHCIQNVNTWITH